MASLAWRQCFLLALVALIACMACVKGDVDPFHYRYPRPTEATLNGAAFGNGVSMVVGNQGTLLRSENGMNWEVCESPADGNYELVYYTNAFYLVTDASSNIYTNIDGSCENWAKVIDIIPEGLDMFDAKFSPSPVPNGWTGGFLAIIDGGIYFSDTGAQFSLVENSGVPDTMEPWAITFSEASASWLLKYGDTTSGNDDDDFDVYTVSAASGTSIVWSQPSNTGLTADKDLSLGVCMDDGENAFVGRFTAGMAMSTDGIDWTVTDETEAGMVFESMECYDERCVAVVDDDEFWETKTCSDGWDKTSIGGYRKAVPNFPVVTLDDDDVPRFLMGSSEGSLLVSFVPGTWVQDGANQEEVVLFQNCEDMVWNGSGFLVSCYRTLLYSEDSDIWTVAPYTVPDDDEQLTLLSPGNDGRVVARAGDALIGGSGDGGLTWDILVRLYTYDDDDNFRIEDNIRFTKDHWLVAASDGQSGEERWPIVVRSNDAGTQWAVMGSNYWMHDFAWNAEQDLYVGAGVGGIFTSEDAFQWTRVSQVNGECTQLASNDRNQFLAVCSNYDVAADRTDIIFKSSLDGLGWTPYSSPCGLTKRDNVVAECDKVMFVEGLNRFVTFDPHPTGTMYATNDVGKSWSQVGVDYAVKIKQVVANTDFMATLTSDVLFGGNTNMTAFLQNTDAGIYQGSTLDQTPDPDYPYVGPIITLPLDPDSYSYSTADHDDDDDGLGGGAIAGIVIGSLAGALVLMAIIVLIVLLIVAAIKTRRKDSVIGEASRLLKNDEGL